MAEINFKTKEQIEEEELNKPKSREEVMQEEINRLNQENQSLREEMTLTQDAVNFLLMSNM